MYVVYWSVITDGLPESSQRSIHSDVYPSADMGLALKKTEDLRKRKLAGEGICFISLVSENPDCVGQMGVDVTGPDYNWMKRRDR